MLDTETKRRIDTARDILVGKLPDPKSQVEQITIALIYKFMDDMDAESEALGGTRKFFAGDFARYGWAKLMRSGLGGHETLNLYAEAIARMPENPGIPLLFREMFKNAFLPYRDPETLRMFLQVIDEFTYDHSERLGDAFEYLLSVLGSQGDAGQFRTPRHIIDFIVAVVDPKKNETVLDPACGTAGFLISSFKHILQANRDANGHSTLTPEERGKLAANFRGYDISPDMVRLSLVNLYLHGFTDPHIYEYDSLTSEERWSEYADVILANPPFMSPKGGIKPHSRFSVQSKRSEVLFVDYIAEHLTLAGRGGIIVPEGIIFQSQLAYTQLRKMLVEKFLVAVVSLPAGVFNPYSGVKTSILILDRTPARKTDSIAFFKIENDGLSLGAQRRAIDMNDLPQAFREISEFLGRLRSGESMDNSMLSLGLVVQKEKIAASGDYNLNGERYKNVTSRTSRFPMVALGEVCELIGGATPSKNEDSYWHGGSVKWISSRHIDEHANIVGHELISKEAVEETSTRVVPKNSTIIITRVSVGKFAVADDEYAINQDLTALVSKDNSRLTPEFIRVIAPHIASVVERAAVGIGVRGVTRSFLANIEIPMPPLEVQKEIVGEIESYRNVIDGARSVLDAYLPQIPIHPEWPLMEVCDLVDFVSGLTVSIPEVECEDGIPILSINNVTEDGKLTLEGLRLIKPPSRTLNYVQKGDLLFNWRNGSKHLVGKTALFDLDGDYLFGSFLLGIRPHPDRVISRYLWHTLNIYRRQGRYMQFMRQNVNGLFNREELKIVRIPVPPISTQSAIVAEIEAEQTLVAANRDLIARFEKKIEATLARVWGADKPAPEEVQ